MKIGIIGSNQNVYKNKNTAFQQNLQKPLSAVESVKLMIRAEKKAKDPRSKKTITAGLEVIKKHLKPMYDQAVLELDFAKKKAAITKQLKSGDLQKQKDAIVDALLFQKESLQQKNENFTKTINNYINKTVINHIKTDKDTDLATFFLAKDNSFNTPVAYNQERQLEQTTSDEALRRIKLIEQLGHSDKHLKELQGYTGNQDGIIGSESRAFYIVSQAADKAIEKLQTNPNF